MKKVIAFILVAMFTMGGVFAQAPSWKSARHSIYWGVGGNLFEGDVCPSDGFFPSFKTLSGSLQLGYQYRLSERFYLRGNLLISRLQGFDADSDLAEEWGRHLNFRSWTWDINAMVDFYLLKMKDITPESTFGQKWGIFITAGFGGAIYTPQQSMRTANDNNVWVNVRRLELEGRDYNNATWVVPVGLGVKYQFNKKFSIGGELVQHMCFTDYLDNVTGNPVNSTADKGTLNALQNTLRGTKANPRGGDKNDFYATALITFTYNFTGCGISSISRPKYKTN